MPRMRKDKESGAIIFDQTPEEKAIEEMKKQLSDVQGSVEDLKKELRALVRQLKKKDKSE